MARLKLQLLNRDGVWQVYCRGALIARMHPDRMSRRRDYLVYRQEGVWRRLLVELVDCTYLSVQKLIPMFVDGLVSRGYEIDQFQYYPRCRFHVDADAITLMSGDRAVYRSRKPLSEYGFLPVAQYKDGNRGMSDLSDALRQDYRNQLIIDGQPEDPHRRNQLGGRGYSFQNHSLYIHSLHLTDQVIAKLYDRVPQYAHLNGVIFGRFMRRPFCYSVTFRDIPPHVLEHRLRKAFEHYYGINFTKRHLEIRYVGIKAEITDINNGVVRTPTGRVLSSCLNAYFLNRRQVRDRLYLGGEYHGLHIMQYPHIRQIMADHLGHMVDAKRANNIIAIAADEPLAAVTPFGITAAVVTSTREVGLTQATQDNVHDHSCAFPADHGVVRTRSSLANKLLSLFPNLNKVRLLVARRV